MARRVSLYLYSCMLAALSLAGLDACQRQDDLPESKTGVLTPIHLSLSVGARTATKMDADTFTELEEDTPVFRGLTDLKMVAFDKDGGLISPDDHALYSPINVPSFSNLIEGISAHFYPNGIDKTAKPLNN